ncbi:MAG: S8 family serine peptidase [Candidatus Zixiibacteriota bacterium]
MNWQRMNNYSIIRGRLPLAGLILASLLLITFHQVASAPAVTLTTSPRQLVQRQPVAMPTQVAVSNLANISHVIVKFPDELGVRIDNGRLYAKSGQSLSQPNAALGSYSPDRLRPLFANTNPKRLDRQRHAAQLSSGHALADLAAYYRIEVTDPTEAQLLVNSLNLLDEVELAFVVPVPEPAGDISPPTPDFQPNQDYREAAPAGIDADYANTLAGGDGAGIKIVDIEGNWQTTHEDLDKALGGIIGGTPLTTLGWGDHGTAVIGELIAGDNGYGVTGICPGADIGMISIGGQSTAEAIYMAINNLQAGDVILIELHAPGPHFNFQSRPDQLGYVCMEYWQDNYDAIQYAWANGIAVIEAAGNGAEDYDDIGLYGQMFDTTWRNSHAILVGAAYPASSFDDRKRIDFSNFGQRVNLQGYGMGVYTTGYGGLFAPNGDEDQFYTSSFGGTSSASPIITGAVACLQGYYKAAFGVLLTPDNIRDALVATGSLQLGDTSEHIGPRPDLQAAITTLSAPPSLYTMPILIDTTVADTIAAVVDLWLFNRGTSNAVDFSIVDNDSLSKSTANWLVAVPSTGTVAPSDSFHINVTLDATLLDDRVERYTGILEIDWGPSGGPLDSEAFVPTYLTIPCNDHTYQALSSGEPNGPEFNWISARDMGIQVPNSAFHGTGANPLDDGTTGALQIGYDFPYYDSTTYSAVYVGVNGGISFTDPDLNVGGFFSTFPLPGSPFQTFVSPFWADLIIDDIAVPQAGLYMYKSSTNDTVVFEWYRLSSFNASDDTTITFEVILTIDGSILFQYLDVGSTGLEFNALIGVSEIECKAFSYVDAGTPIQNIVSDLTAVSLNNATRVWTRSGDFDGNGSPDIVDLTMLVEFLFDGGPAPVPPEAGDVNCDGLSGDIVDLTYFVDFLFAGGDPLCFFFVYL